MKFLLQENCIRVHTHSDGYKENLFCLAGYTELENDAVKKAKESLQNSIFNNLKFLKNYLMTFIRKYVCGDSKCLVKTTAHLHKIC